MRARAVCSTLTLAGALVAAPTVATAQEPDSLTAESGHRPSVLRASDLIYAGLFFGSLAAVQPLEDLEEGLSPDRPPTGFPRTVHSTGNILGNGFVAYAAGGLTLAVGKLAGDDRTARIGLRSIEALLLADLLVTPFKVGLGRRRPTGFDPEPNTFVPGSFTSEYNSFPSGHTAHAFAIASTLSRELKHQEPWVPFVVYPMATLVGASRVIGKKHWVTDVVAGAAAGLFAGRFIGRLHGEEEIGLRIAPIVGASGEGVLLGATIGLP